MSKSMLYTVNTSTQNLVDGSEISLGNTIRRFGCNCNLSNNAIKIQGMGYYTILANITIAPTVAETVITITAYKDGVAIPGATAQVIAAAAGDVNTVPIAMVLRENCACCDNTSTITFSISGGAAAVTNIVTISEKL